MADAILKLYNAAGTTEYGTLGSPIVFTGAVAGTIVSHPINPFYLWNDKGGVVGSVPAKEIEIQLLDMWIQDEDMGTSDGLADQAFTCVVIPVIDNADPEEIIVTVDTSVWIRVGSLAGQASDAEVYTFNATTGVVTFGNGVNGKIPPLGNEIYITYMPDLLSYGKEIFEETWLEIKSFGVTTNAVSVVDEQTISNGLSLVTALNLTVLSVSGVWLQTDPGHSGTNYYTGGSFNPNNGQITLGTPLPDAFSPVLINYSHTPIDDAESNYTPIGLDTTHTFVNPIPKNNAKLLYLRLNVPSTAQTNGGSNLNFRLQLKYRQ